MGHVKPCGKLEGPSSKAKYYIVTDSELVPRGKGEKNRGDRNETVSEIILPTSSGSTMYRKIYV